MSKDDKEYNSPVIIIRKGLIKCNCSLCREGIAYHTGRVINYGKHLDSNAFLTKEQVIKENLAYDVYRSGDYSYRINRICNYIKNGKNLLKGKQAVEYECKNGDGKIIYWEKYNIYQKQCLKKYINLSEKEILSYELKARFRGKKMLLGIKAHNIKYTLLSRMLIFINYVKNKLPQTKRS